mmetsp:Transcript_4574/g.8007  ORF Transcript_4574/g.8007 Transcript_4574/m.8007 type:complete len:201 (+) Transcript_4574:398-1000(+)
MASSLRPMSRDSPSTYSKEMFTIPGYLFSLSPFICTLSILDVIALINLSLKFVACSKSLSMSCSAISHAFPKPITRGGARVPDLIPLSCPPPLMMGSTLTLGLLLRYIAPMPFGPYNLWPLMDMRSMFISFTSIGIFPTACAASVWKNTLCLRQMAPISLMGWMTPISLFTAITETIAVSFRIAPSSFSKSMSPFDMTGR